MPPSFPMARYMSDTIPSGLEPGQEIGDDDPRMPNIVATENPPREMLLPFHEHVASPIGEQEGYDGGLDSPVACEELRGVLVEAADLALLAFGSAAPAEFFWPASGRPETGVANNDELQLECFGLWMASHAPRTEMEHRGSLCRVEVVVEPFDSETTKRQFDKDLRTEILSKGKNSRFWDMRDKIGLGHHTR